MELKDRINAIKPYFKSCMVMDNRFLVITQFGNGWSVPNAESVLNKHGVAFEIKQNNECYFGIGMDKDYNVIFDVIESIIKRNKEKEERQQLYINCNKQLNELFETYKQQLKDMFKDKTKTLDYLRNLSVTYQEALISCVDNNGLSEEEVTMAEPLNIVDDEDDMLTTDVVVDNSVKDENVEVKEGTTENTVTVVPTEKSSAKRGRPAKSGGSLLNKAVGLAKK